MTFTPGTMLPKESFTVTARALARAWVTVADCGVVPALAVMVEAAPGLLVSEKLTAARLAAAADTV